MKKRVIKLESTPSLKLKTEKSMEFNDIMGKR